MKDNSVYLHHILECTTRIERNTNQGRDQFMESHTLQDAVMRNLQVIAESTQRLSDKIKSSQPEIEWDRISAFRNVIVHDYLGVDLNVIWQITQRDIPELKQAVLSMLKSNPSGNQLQ